MTEADTGQAPWLDPSEQQAWRAFLGGVTVLWDQLGRDLRRNHELSMAEYEILVRLSEAPGHTVRMAELADAVVQSRSRVTHTIGRLETAGIVQRGQDVSDGRGVNAHLTESGFALLQEAAHTHVQGVRTYLLENAEPHELQTIGQVMERIIRDLHGKRF